MKKYNFYLLFFFASIGSILSGCDRVDEKDSAFDNVIYVENAKSNNKEQIMLKATALSDERVIRAGMALPVAEDIKVKFKPDLSLVNSFNLANYMESESLPEKYFSLSETEAIIPAGNIISTDITVLFKNLEDMPRNINYTLPISIEAAENVSIQNGARTIYYVLKKGATITTAALFKENYLEFPTMKSSEVMDNLSYITFEGLVNPNELANSVNTFMGVEGYCLLRFGDKSFEPNRLELATKGGDNCLSDLYLTIGKWQHVAVTVDLVQKEVIFYKNGQEVSRNNGRPAFNGNMVHYGTKLATASEGDRQFYVGYSFDKNRDFDGEMCEIRIWNVIRSQEEIVENMYEVDPESEGLIAYWKLDEGSGNSVKDYTGNNLNGVSNSTLRWMPADLPAQE